MPVLWELRDREMGMGGKFEVSLINITQQVSGQPGIQSEILGLVLLVLGLNPSLFQSLPRGRWEPEGLSGSMPTIPLTLPSPTPYCLHLS